MSSQPIYSVQPEVDESLGHGEKDVSSAGTAEALASTTCHEVLIQAKITNTGRIYIGGASVPNDDTGGIYLTAGQSIPLSVTNLNQIYINSTVNSEGVTFLYW